MAGITQDRFLRVLSAAENLIEKTNLLREFSRDCGKILRKFQEKYDGTSQNIDMNSLNICLNKFEQLIIFAYGTKMEEDNQINISVEIKYFQRFAKVNERNKKYQTNRREKEKLKKAGLPRDPCRVSIADSIPNSIVDLNDQTEILEEENLKLPLNDVLKIDYEKEVEKWAEIQETKRGLKNNGD
jgi:hypothetical protein